MAFTKASYTQSYVDAAVPVGHRRRDRLEVADRMDCRRGLGICLDGSLDAPARISVRELPDHDQRAPARSPTPRAEPIRSSGSADLVIQTARAGVNFKF